MPNINTITPIVPETATFARAGDPLPPGDGPAHQDGVAGDGNDVLVIYEYMGTSARHQHPSYGNGWDYYYQGIGTMVDDLHYFGYTVDTWYNYYYVGSYTTPGQRQMGTYDGQYRYNYYPVDSRGWTDTIDSYDDYQMVVIIGYSSMWTLGMYNYNGNYETARPVTAERTLTGLEDYVNNGGSLLLAGYYTPYYLFYYPYYVGNAAVRSSVQQRLSALFDCTAGYYGGRYGYGAQGMEGPAPNGDDSIGVSSRDYEGLWGSTRTGSQTSGQGTYLDIEQGNLLQSAYHSVRNPFPDSYPGYSTYRNYQYLYYTQYPINDGFMAREHAYTYGRNPNDWIYDTPNAIQSDHGGAFKTVLIMSHLSTGTSYYRHSSGSYRYGPSIMEAYRIPLLGSIIDYFGLGGDAGPPVEKAELSPTEIDSSGTDDEQVEFANIVNFPINLHNWSATTDGSGRAPSSYFGDYSDLSDFGVPGLLEDQTFYLNAEDLYIDTYWAPGTGTYDNFYLYKVSSGNDYGKYYRVGSTTLTWWDSNDQVFLTDLEKDGKNLGYLEDYVYQISLPADWWYGHQYVRLNTGDDHKYETNQLLYSTNSGGTYLDLHWESLVDGNVTTPNTETQALSDYWNATIGTQIKSATLSDYYVRSTLTSGYYLYLYDDNDSSYMTAIYMPSSSAFWKITSLPYQGTIFVNDNHPTTMFHYSHLTGGQVGGPGANIQDIDITDGTYFDHYTNEEYFQDESRTYGSTTIDFTGANARNQITTVTLTAPILTDTVYVNKNTGAIVSGPGTNIVEITLDLMEDDYSWLFPKGSTYRDYSVAGAPTRSLSHLIVVTDEFSDVDGNKNELVANGMLYIWHTGKRKYIGEPSGWGTSGFAPEPAGSMTAQAYFDGSKYKFGEFWTLGSPSIGSDNSVPAPAYGSVDVVINEINPAFVELYNRGGSSVRVTGWKLTGEGNTYTLNGNIAPGGFMTISESVFYIPFTPGTGGRVSLFDDLGVAVSSIGYQTDVTGNQYSYAARHIDGVGVDFGYNDSMLTPWALGEEDAQKNADWELGPARTTGIENYDGMTFLQIGKVKDSDWSLIENLSNYNADWADGSYGVLRIDDLYLNNFDVVFCLSGLSANSQWILDDYIMSGGRLYVEYGDWSTLAATDFYNHIGVSALQASGPVSVLTGAEPVTGGMQMAYTGTYSSKFTPTSESFRVWEEGGTVLTVLSVDIDTQDPDNSYRVVASAVKYEKMSEMTRGDMPYDYIGVVVDYFQLNDDDVNHQPVIELKDPLADPEIPLFKARPTLLWQNKDIDVWDQVAGTMEYTLYISTNQNDVANMDMDAQSAVFVQETATATMVDALDAPVAGIYYWGIFAEDKYGKTTYASGGVFKYDSEVPSVNSMTAGNTDTGVWDDPLPIGITRVFGPGYMNSQGETVGRPDIFAIDLSDNFGLKFSNNHNMAHQLFKDEYIPPATAFSVQVLYFYGGQYEDDLPNFNLYVDTLGTNADLESLTGLSDVTFYMIPDGPIPDGQYHFYIQAADEVRWGSYMDWTFEIDLTAPDQPVDIMIDPATYLDMFDELFLKAGETYTLSVTAPSSSDDGSMNRIEFQQAVANFPGATWETIGTDFDVSDNTYSVLWTPDTEHFYLRAIAYDYVENFVISEVFSAFHVDGVGPEAPLTMQATLDLTHTPKATVSGYVFDTIIEGQTSGVAYVILWHYDSASDTMEAVTDDQGMIVQVPVIDLSFSQDVDLDSITGATGDKAYAFYAQAIDNVGNEGEMSQMATWTNTGEMESLRVISPSSIKDVPMGMDVDDTDDSLDELRSITVTFLNTEQDFMNYMFTIRAQRLRTSTDATGLGLPQGTKFLYNYFNVEVPPEFTNFEAQVTIEFHLSSRSQLGTKTADILNNIRLVSKHSDENRFAVIEIIGGQPQPVDEAKGLYRVQARVNRFSDFAVIVAQTDVTVKEIILGASPAISGQELSITVTVHNGGDFPKDAENVRVKVFAIDADGNQEFIDELDYGTIDAETDYYLSDPGLMKGDKQATLYWTTSELLADGEVQTFTIRAQVDPDGYVREISETNNEKTRDVEVVGSAKSSPSFELTFMLMALGVLVISGMSVYVRKRD